MGQDEPARAEGPAVAAVAAGNSQEQHHSIKYKIEHRTATNSYAFRKSWRVGQLAKEFKRQVLELKCKSLSPELGRSIAERAQAQLHQGEAEETVKAWGRHKLCRSSFRPNCFKHFKLLLFWSCSSSFLQWQEN